MSPSQKARGRALLRAKEKPYLPGAAHSPSLPTRGFGRPHTWPTPWGHFQFPVRLPPSPSGGSGGIL